MYEIDTVQIEVESSKISLQPEYSRVYASSILLTATIVGRYGQPQKGVKVVFSVDGTTFSPSSNTTNSNGEATTRVFYSGPPKGFTVTATAEGKSATASVYFTYPLEL
jgi:hypothetical protein